MQRPANTPVNHGYAGHRLVRAWERLRFWLQGNSKRQARRNIAAHYDLGNDFYRFWLDDSMTYSSAIFESPQDSLEAAQERKYASMVDRIGAQPGDHVLEIGCGWGGFAEYAAGKRGLRVTALTISRAQHDYAVKRMPRAGLGLEEDRARLEREHGVEGAVGNVDADAVACRGQHAGLDDRAGIVEHHAAQPAAQHDDALILGRVAVSYTHL